MTIEGNLEGEGLHIGIAVASWNAVVTGRLLAGALRRCEESGVSQATVIQVPGALELAVTARALINAGCDAIVAIGTVVKGDTDHYDIVVRESTSSLSRLATDTGVPVAQAVLAVHNVKDALSRAGDGPDNKGYEAAEAAILTATALRELTGGIRHGDG